MAYDFDAMSSAELEELQEEIKNELKCRSEAFLNRALSEVATLVQEWSDKRVYFYVMDDEDNEIPIYPREIRATREWI